MFFEAVSPVVASHRFGAFDKKAYHYRPVKSGHPAGFEDALRTVMRMSKLPI